MDYEIKLWCSSCGSVIDSNEDIACEGCVKTFEGQISELESKVRELEDDILKLEDELGR